MSNEKPRLFDRKQLKTYPLSSRDSKMDIGQLAKPPGKNPSFQDFLDALPPILAGRSFKEVVEALRRALRKNRLILLGMGAHPIKCGLNPILIDGMKKGWLKALALNGAGVIHDFEIACAGITSEEVRDQIADGSFGMAEETGREINDAFKEGVAKGWGLGKAIGRYLNTKKPPHLEYSITATADRLGVPVSVHVAIGTDIIHMHPSCDGKVIGEGSYRDFLAFTELVKDLEGGGVYLNVGSAVLLPEVFLKAVSMVRNSGAPLTDFTTVNFDFLQMYRPTENVVKRPIIGTGKGYAITGHHEILIPMLAFALSIEENEPS
ncbi:hypothetical protein ACFLU6_06930 [Acidobacteriota bacterium]